MSAPVLTVGRLTATVRVDGPDDGAGRRVDAILRQVVAARLARAWSGAGLPPGHWCLRRVRLGLEVELGRGDHELGEQWAQALVSGIGTAVRQGAVEVVHYRHRLDALADAVGRLALGDADRAWAWAQVGVLAPGGPDPAAAPGPAALAALLERPEQAVPALATAARRCGMAALDRALGSDGWRQLAGRLWATAAGRAEEPVPATPATAGPTFTASPPWVGPAAPPPAVLAASELAAAIGRSRLAPPEPVLDAWAVLVALELDPVLPRRNLAPRQLGRVRASLAAASPTARTTTDPTLRHPPAGTREPGTLPAAPRTPPARPAVTSETGTLEADALAAGTREASTHPSVTREPSGLATGSGEPATCEPATAATRPDVTGAAATRPAGRAGPRWGSVADGGSGGAGSSTTLRGRAAQHAGARESGGDAGARGTGGDAGVRGASGTAGQDWGPDGEARSGRPTDWAGLPFLLATASAAGLPDRLLEDPAFEARPVAWCVHAAGQAVAGAPGDDPGLLALAGLQGARAAAVAAEPPPGDAEQAAIDQLARDWIAVTAARLAAAATDPEADGHWTGAEPDEAVARLVRRPGRVVADPGWIEIHLPLTGVDPVVRRAGLDADPGWVGWLGTVVRFVYT